LIPYLDKRVGLVLNPFLDALQRAKIDALFALALTPLFFFFKVDAAVVQVGEPFGFLEAVDFFLRTAPIVYFNMVVFLQINCVKFTKNSIILRYGIQNHNLHEEQGQISWS